MIKNNDYKIGTIVKLKKPHPSGTIEWEIVRLGADIKIHSKKVDSLYLMLPRNEFNKKVKEIINY